MTPEQILSANAPRAALLRAQWDAYDPVRGIGSPVARVAFRWRDAGDSADDGRELFIPEAMLDDPDAGAALRWCVDREQSAEAYYAAQGAPFGDAAWAWFCRLRLQYDYEYWCATCARVEDKRTKTLVPFTLTPPQRASFAAREQQRQAGRPVRQIELKHRQYGSSTEKQAYLFWLQNVVTDGRHAWLLSLSNGGAAEIARRFEIIAEHLPSWAGAVTMEGVRGSTTTRRVAESGSLVGIASSNNPQGPSGYTAHLVLISEAGKMGSTDVQSAERLITNVTSTVPREPDTCILVESTAEAVGRWFRLEVEAAQRGDSAYAFHFTTWTTDPTCWTPLERAECVHRAGSVEKWVAGLDGLHLALFTEHGATLEQVAWYVDAEAEKPAPWMMQQENPTTPEEAFQYGERRRFLPPHVATARKANRDPRLVGRLVADSLTGPGALRGIRFVPDPRGELSIWRLPSDDYNGFLQPSSSHYYSHAFAAAMDIGGTWEHADYTDIPILDRRPTAHGAPPEVVAEWHGHLDQDLAAWEAARLAMFYGRALLAVEVNSLREDMGDEADGLEPEHSLTVLDQIAHAYPNLYRRKQLDRVTRQWTERLGWHTNRESKPRAVDLLNRALREGHEDGGGYVEPSANACDEMDTYLVTDKGKLQAAPGKKDDAVMTRAILMALHEELPPCAVVAKASEAADRAAMARAAQAWASV